MTTRSLPLLRVRATENRVRFLEGQVDQLLLDHHEARQCSECEELLGEMSSLLVVIHQLDRQMHELYFDGLPYNPEFSSSTRELFVRWFALGNKSLTLAAMFEAKGYGVQGIEDFRQRCLEVEACLNPSDEMNDAFAALETSALEQHDRSETLAGLVDE
jgi:hypothetical protein